MNTSKHTRRQFEKAIGIPPEALTIKQYARKHDISHTMVYKKFDSGKADFKIMDFCGINWVVPNSKIDNV